jgi:hypothetical protein
LKPREEFLQLWKSRAWRAPTNRSFDRRTNSLNQARVDTEYVWMEDVGLTGNGHMMMLELTSIEIAQPFTAG